MATPVSISCTSLSVLSCGSTWVRNLPNSFSGLVVAAYQGSAGCAFDQPQPCCLAGTAAVRYSQLSTHGLLRHLPSAVSQLLCACLPFPSSTCLFSLEKVMICSVVGPMWWGCFNEYRKQRSLCGFFQMSALCGGLLSVEWYLQYSISNFTHQ